MFKIKKSKEVVESYGDLARRRISCLSTVEILDWADQVGSGLALALQDYRRAGTVESLYEAEAGATALSVIVEELLSRETGPQ